MVGEKVRFQIVRNTYGKRLETCRNILWDFELTDRPRIFNSVTQGI